MMVAFLYLRTTLGLLFLVAGLSKAWDRRAFQDAVTGFRIVSPRLTRAVATVIMSLELAGADCCLRGFTNGWELFCWAFFLPPLTMLSS